MDSTELIKLISGIKRDMPHNKRVVELCEAAEHLIMASQVKAKRVPLTRAEIQRNYRLRKRAMQK